MTAPIFNFYSKTHKLFVRISILPTETCSEKYSAFQFLIKKKICCHKKKKNIKNSKYIVILIGNYVKQKYLSIFK